MPEERKPARPKPGSRRYRMAEPAKAPVVEEQGLVEEISLLRGQVQQIGDRLLELEALQIARARDAARTDWSPGRGIGWAELRAKARVIVAKHGL